MSSLYPCADAASANNLMLVHRLLDDGLERKVPRPAHNGSRSGRQGPGPDCHQKHAVQVSRESEKSRLQREGVPHSGVRGGWGGGQRAAGYVNVSYQDIFGQTAVHMAALHGNVDMLELLLLHGADVHVHNYFNYSALDYCLWSGPALRSHQIRPARAPRR